MPERESFMKLRSSKAAICTGAAVVMFLMPVVPEVAVAKTTYEQPESTVQFDTELRQASYTVNVSDIVATGYVEEKETGMYAGMAIAIADPYTQVYAMADENSEVVGQMGQNSIASAEEIVGEWTKIVSGNLTGFVKTSELCFNEEAQALGSSLGDVSATVVADSAALYLTADKSQAADFAANGTQFKAVGKKGSMIAVEYGESKAYVYADHIVFNSPHQLAKFGPAAKAAGKSVGLRVNPEYSTQEGHEIYDPCAPGSRLGTTRAQWDAAAAQHPDLPDLLDGLHFHTLCEQDSDALAATLPALEAKFGDLLPRMKWLNFGGGHHITRPDYDLATLEKCITGTQEKYGVQVYLEPGEAWALNAGYLVTTVLDTLQNGETHLAILDMSAACHTPDVIEMPYRPPLLDAGEPGEKPCTFRLGGPTCLAGDVVSDYSFAAPLTEGDRLIFGDMAIYSTCKNNTFNGMPLPDIWVLHENGTTQPLARFGYHDFKYRLGSPR